MMTVPTDLSDLVRHATEEKDVYAAAALHPWVQPAQRRLLEDLWSERRQALLLAQMEGTPATVLEQLFALNDASVDARLARHGNTAAVVLEKLFQRSQAGAQRQRLRRYLVANPATPHKVLLQWVEAEQDLDVLKGLCANSGAEPEVLGLAAQRGIAALHTLLAVNLASNSAVLQHLWAGATEGIAAQILGHPQCPEALLETIPNTVLQRRKLAGNARAPSPVLQVLSADKHWSVRRAAAGNAATPVALLTALSRDEAEAVRRVVAMRPDLPVTAAAWLAEDDDDWVRQVVARNIITDSEVLGRLAQDAVMEVRRAVARNPACSAPLVAALAKDENEWVRAGVAYRADVPAQVLHQLEAGETSADVLSGIAQNAAASQHMLQQLVQHENPDVRRAVILNKMAPRALLQNILQDPYALHRGMVLGHPHLHDEDRWQLHQDPDPRVRFAVYGYFGRRLGMPKTSGTTM